MSDCACGESKPSYCCLDDKCHEWADHVGAENVQLKKELEELKAREPSYYPLPERITIDDGHPAGARVYYSGKVVTRLRRRLAVAEGALEEIRDMNMTDQFSGWPLGRILRWFKDKAAEALENIDLLHENEKRLDASER